MEALLEQLKRSPKLMLYVDELQATLRREQAARERFRATLTEDVRAEFINGEVVDHVTSRYKHILVVRRIERLLSAFLDVRKLGVMASEHSLSTFTRNDYLPDISVWLPPKADEIDLDQLLFPVPDFICEVLSPSTEAHDRGVKFEDYAAHGVGEYWLVDPDALTVEQYLLKDGTYALHVKANNGDITSTVVPGFTMPVAAAFDDDANLAALWKLAPR